MNNKNLLVLLYISISVIVSGCASNNSTPTPIKASEMERIKYGMSYSIIQQRLNHPGLPLYKFLSAGKEYYIAMYRPSFYEQSFLFLFENNILVSIIKTETGVRIWNRKFGRYKRSLPVKQYISDAIFSFKKQAIYIGAGYITEDKTKKTRNNEGFYESKVSTQLYEIGSTWGLAILPVFIGAGFITSKLEDTSSRTNSTVAIKSKEYYRKILKLFGEIKLGSSTKLTIEKIGIPNKQYNKGIEKILIYSTTQTTIYGFTDNKLQWIAFDYPVLFSEE